MLKVAALVLSPSFPHNLLTFTIVEPLKLRVKVIKVKPFTQHLRKVVQDLLRIFNRYNIFRRWQNRSFLCQHLQLFFFLFFLYQFVRHLLFCGRHIFGRGLLLNWLLFFFDSLNWLLKQYFNTLGCTLYSLFLWLGLFNA